jgi:glucan phosphoethanolaminetransferase (alkaline phosphatase superfamily)
MLDNLIKTIEAKANSAVLLYISDHGQDVHEQTCENNAIGRSGINSFKTPALIWLSDTYRKNNPNIVRILRENHKHPFLSNQVSQTLIGLAEGDSALTKALDKGFLSGGNFQKNRMVFSGSKWMDFDKLHSDSQCHLKYN